MARTLRAAYMGLDQYGTHYDIGHASPRRWLLDHFGRQHAERMYCDVIRGGRIVGSRHTGWIIAGCWVSVYRVLPLHPPQRSA